MVVFFWKNINDVFFHICFENHVICSSVPLRKLEGEIAKANVTWASLTFFMQHPQLRNKTNQTPHT
jgi:hypothetical protein